MTDQPAASPAEPVDYKATLNLPDTSFAMKANLAAREVKWLEDWYADGLYQHIRAARRGRPQYILHDGPPYANGSIHLGHALNKILKDMIVKSRTLDGLDAPYVPGWDCHGLPIELKVEEKIGKVGDKVDATTFRRACRDYALSQIELQKKDFQRLGVLGDWDQPYLTMNFAQEANIVRALAVIQKNGHVQAGLKPVNWCLDCGSSLAEAEVEYEDKQSDAIYVGFDIVNREALPATATLTGPLQAVIWTTTPWTLPANQAIAASADLDYAIVQVTLPYPAFVQPEQLDTKRFVLRPLTSADKKALQQAASDPQIWDMMPDQRHEPAVFGPYFKQALAQHALAIVDKASGELVGTTRFYDDGTADNSIAIGYTFLTRAYWGTGANAEIKQALLAYAFEQRDVVRFHIAPNNTRSVKAVEKLGATFEKTAAMTAGERLFYRLNHPDETTRPQRVVQLIVAHNLLDDLISRFGATAHTVLATVNGAELTALRAQHPLIAERQVPIITGEHVTADSGTGLVHTAPAHGVDDYVVGRKYQLATENPVAGNGVYLPEARVFVGEHIYKAQPKIIATLRASGHLLRHDVITHSYPHCWRHKTPIIFRATPQWFISMDQGGLRQTALQAIEQQIEFVPQWGQQRLQAMIEGRPDWCISRQRTWGVPIPFFVHKDSHALHPRTSELLEHVAQLIEREGIEGWFERDVGDFLPADEASEYVAVRDTLDVWFDSGTTHHAVLAQREDLHDPADLYLEGSDQHRGWFQTSLLTSIAMHGRAPYKGLLTHGFTVDEHGRKLSKSLGNYIPIDEIIQQLGADGLRLYVASSDYRYEVTASKEIFNRVSDSYRRIRNTLRFLLANLNGFVPERDALPADQLIALDQYMIRRAQTVQDAIRQAYTDMNFHAVVSSLTQFCINDLGGFYLDIIKDRQYTTKADSQARRSAQTALYHLVQAFVRWMAPILSFTAQEAWPLIPGQQDKYVFTAEWYKLPAVTSQQHLTDEDWQTLLQVKSAVNKQIEVARAAKQIGSNLSAQVELWADSALKTLLDQLGDELRFVLITSQVAVHALDATQGEATEVEGLRVAVKPAKGEKCVRCWHVLPDVNTHAGHAGLCARCIINLPSGPGEVRQYA